MHACYIALQLEELQDKETQLQTLSEEKDVNQKQQAALQHRIIKDIDMTKKKLAHERSLKLDAFQRVDDLQALVSKNF